MEPVILVLVYHTLAMSAEPMTDMKLCMALAKERVGMYVVDETSPEDSRKIFAAYCVPGYTTGSPSTIAKIGDKNVIGFVPNRP